MPARRSHRFLLVVLMSSMVGLAISPGPASAHTDFDYSLPADGASVEVPVDEITVAFTSPVALVGDGFAVLDPQNNELTPVALTGDDTVFRLRFDPPLAGGTVGVKYEVRVADGHLLTGNFVFVVDVPAPTTAPSATAPPAPTTPTGTATMAPTTPPPATTATTGRPTTTPAATDDPAGSPATSSVPSPSGETDDDSGSASGIVFALAAAVALAVGGVLVVRSRTGT